MMSYQISHGGFVGEVSSDKAILAQKDARTLVAMANESFMASTTLSNMER